MRKLAVVMLALAFLAVTAGLAWRTYRKLNVPGQPHAPIADTFGMEDFRDAVYYPPKAFLEGNDPYYTERYLEKYPVRQVFPPYSPLVLLVHAPITLVPFEPAEYAYFFFVVALAPLLAYVVLEYAGLRPNAVNVLGLAVLILASRASYINQTAGSLGMQLAIVSILALRFAQSRPWVSGVALALATCKPTFGVPLAILMLCRRDFRAVAIGFVLGAIGAGLGTAILIAEEGGLPQFFHALQSSFHHFEHHEAVDPASSFGRIDATVIMLRILRAAPAAAVKIATPLALLGLVGGVLALLSRDRQRPGVETVSAALICMAVVAFAHHQVYDALLLFYPLTAVAAARLSPWREMPRARRWLLVGLLAVPLYNYGTLTIFMNRLTTGGAGWVAMSMVSGLALLAAISAGTLWAAFGRRSQSRPSP